MIFMQNNLRKFQARQLYSVVDQWLDQTLRSRDLWCEYEFDCAVKIYHNNVLINTSPEGKILLQHSQNHKLTVECSGGQCRKIMIDNFDCKHLFDWAQSSATLEFDEPFAIWYIKQPKSNQPTKLLADRVQYQNEHQHIIVEIFRKLKKLQY